MRIYPTIGSILVAICIAMGTLTPSGISPTSASTLPNLARVSSTLFIENRGQFASGVKMLAKFMRPGIWELHSTEMQFQG